MLRDGVRDEARALRIDVAITEAALAMREETLRDHQMKLILGPRHGDVEKPAFLLDLRRRADAEVGRNAPIDHVEDED